MAETKLVRIAAVSDLHYGKHSKNAVKDLFEAASARADVLLLCGDLTDYGLAEEAEILAADIRAFVRIPVLGVLGNHDFESGTAATVREIMEDVGVDMLDGECAEVNGVGFAGVAGFGGGFGRHMLNAWGESLIKQFVQASVEEALKLEQALTKMETEHRVVLMHYAPICQTVQGEPLEIYPFLGSSRLEEPLNRFQVLSCFHGHAHKGAPEGRTSAGIPVYNVSLQVLKALDKEEPPFRMLEVDTSIPAPTVEVAV
ncbi:MAG TPA: metallophosphoesterase [Rhodothermales bacterium]|nr:metallophosphoesterase [Rhodothermales bacterium]